MSFSDAIDDKYRIHAADLDSRTHRLVISNISYQGVEEMRPVLHFEGLTKRLVLTQQQSYDMIRLTHSSIPTEWIGETVLLEPVHVGGDAVIEILSPWAKMPRFTLARWVARFTRANNKAAHKAAQGAIAVVLVAVLAAVAWLALQSGDAIRSLLPAWLAW